MIINDICVFNRGSQMSLNTVPAVYKLNQFKHYQFS